MQLPLLIPKPLNWEHLLKTVTVGLLIAFVVAGLSTLVHYKIYTNISWISSIGLFVCVILYYYWRVVDSELAKYMFAGVCIFSAFTFLGKSVKGCVFTHSFFLFAKDQHHHYIQKHA